MLKYILNKASILIFGIIVLFSCSDENKNPCEGLILDIITQTLIIELVDNDGNNLIENENYDKEFLFYERNGFITKPIVYDEEEIPNLPNDLKNVILITINSNGEKDNIWTIHLNEQEVDILKLNLEVESSGCSGPFYNILDVKYNEDRTGFQDIGNNTYKITVLK